MAKLSSVGQHKVRCWQQSKPTPGTKKPMYLNMARPTLLKQHRGTSFRDAVYLNRL